MNVPLPADAAFVDRVRELVFTADLEARMLAGMPRRKPKRAQAVTPRTRPAPLSTLLRPSRPTVRQFGRCRACGAVWDGWTPGCRGCVARHDQRPRQRPERFMEPAPWLRRKQLV